MENYGFRLLLGRYLSFLLSFYRTFYQLITHKYNFTANETGLPYFKFPSFWRSHMTYLLYGLSILNSESRNVIARNLKSQKIDFAKSIIRNHHLILLVIVQRCQIRKCSPKIRDFFLYGIFWEYLFLGISSVKKYLTEK